MSDLSKFAKAATATAMAAAAFVPAALAAQADVRSSPVPSYHLVQVSVDASAVPAEEFEAQTKAIQSCDDAARLARTLDADFTRNRFIRANQMPQQLQDILADLPTGQSTPVFSADGKQLRVLVLCARV